MTKVLMENMDKLIAAKSAEEIAKILEAAGDIISDEKAAQIFKEIREHSGDAELSADELDAVSGGSHRDWVTDGCAATVEYASWCGSNDACTIWDVTYDNEPLKSTCPTCGISLYFKERKLEGVRGARIYRCKQCGYEKTIYVQTVNNIF